LLNIEGLGRQLYPDLDLWQTAKPFLERWMNEQVGPRAFASNLRTSLPMWTEMLPEIPQLLHQTLKHALTGKFKVQWASQELRQLRQEVRRSNRRNVAATIGGSLVVSSALIYGLDGFSPVMLLGAPVLTWLLGGIGIVFLIGAWPDDRP